MPLSAPPPVQTPFAGATASGVSSPWLRFFQVVSSWFNSTTTSASAGTGSALPATVQGYLVIQINGTQYKVPYYL